MSGLWAQTGTATSEKVYGPLMVSDTAWSILLLVLQCLRLQLLVILETNK